MRYVDVTISPGLYGDSSQECGQALQSIGSSIVFVRERAEHAGRECGKQG